MDHGRQYWRVRFTKDGRVQRLFFNTFAEADSKASSLRGEALQSEQEWALLLPAERERLMAIWREAKRKGVDLWALTQQSQAAGVTVGKGIGAVIEEMLLAKKNSGRSMRYLAGLKSVCLAFAKNNVAKPVDTYTLMDLEIFLDSRNIRGRSTVRSRLSTLFKFSMRRRYRLDNPCAALDHVTVPYVTPKIFTVKEIVKIMKWLQANPRLLGWFALTTFCGLRPEESQNTEWKFIDLAACQIRVEAQTSKMRERRIVVPKPMAIVWLKRAKRRGSMLPISREALRRDRLRLREHLGWTEWPKDITRHSAASYWLAESGDIQTVAHALGHSEKILRKNYMALVTKEEAEKFWAV